MSSNSAKGRTGGTKSSGSDKSANTNSRVSQRAHSVSTSPRRNPAQHSLQASIWLAQEKCWCQAARELLHTFPATSSSSVGCSARSMASCRKQRPLVIRRRCRNVENDWKNVRSHAVLQTALISNSCSSAARMHVFQTRSVWRRASL